MFHLHFDATVMPEELARYSAELGFRANDFTGHPEGFMHFEPNRHETLKLDNRKRTNEVWAQIERKARETEFVGYLEGEFIRSSIRIPDAPFDDSIRIPFELRRRRLTGTPNEMFRETELHLTLDKDRSDPRLLRKLLDAGLFGAYTPKNSYVALVLTAQGYIRDLDPLTIILRDYLARAGGTVCAKLKEERAIRHALIGITPAQLPEIVDSVVYNP